MRALRIYPGPNLDGSEDILNVRHVSVTAAGALAVEIEHGEQRGTLRGVIIAAGQWTRVEDWNADGDQDQDQPRAAEQLPPPVPAHPDWCKCGHPGCASYPGPVVHDDPAAAPAVAELEQSAERVRTAWRASLPALPAAPLGIVADPLQLSHASRLREALGIYCVCAGLRCPATVYRGLVGGGTAEPLQCDQLDGHDGEHDNQRRWTYGPGVHHPKCPRHPGNYNRNTGTCGRLLEIESVPMIGTGCLLPPDHDGAHDYATPAEGQPEQPAGLTAATIPTQRDRAAAGRAVRGELVTAGAPARWPAVADPAPERVGELLSGLVEPRPLVDHVFRAHSSPDDWFRARTIGQTCDDPERTGTGLRCSRPAGHDHGPHAASDPNSGDLLQW